MKQTTIVAIVLSVLVLISLAQAFQLNGLKTRIADGSANIAGSSNINAPVTSSGSSSPRAAALPKSVQNLPQMVGGC